jgi:hypothetical protein
MTKNWPNHDQNMTKKTTKKWATKSGTSKNEQNISKKLPKNEQNMSNQI